MKSIVSISPKAQIAESVVIENFVTIERDVIIEEGTWIGPNVTIMEGARIGKNCSIFPGAVISAIPQDKKFKNEKTTVEIGDDTVIREYVTINRGTVDKWKTKIGSRNLIMAYSHIAHDCVVGDDCIFSNGTTLAGHVVVGDFAVMAGMTAVQQFCKIGAHSFVTGGSLVRKDVPPYIKVAREPLSYVGINSVGLRRRGFSNEQIVHIQNIYRIIFQKGYNNTQAISIIEAELEATPERDNIIQFIKNSERGIVKGYNSESER